MKCVYCSTPVSRTDWFCPHCKRGIRRPRRRSSARMVALLLGVGLTGMALRLAVPASRPEPAPAVADAEWVPVSVRPLPPTPTAEELAKQAVSTAPRLEALSRSTPAASHRELRVAVAASARAADTRFAEAGSGAVSVSTDSGMDTYVYLNGGSLLGKAPLEDAPIPAGNQTLVFWTPAVGGRSTRRIRMEPGQKMVLIESVARSDRFAPPEGG